MKKRVYSNKAHEQIKEQIPISIIKAMAEVGWNVFGVYEIVNKVLKEEKKQNERRMS